MLNELKHPEEILREAQNDRCLQFGGQYSKTSLSLYCLNAIALTTTDGSAAEEYAAGAGTGEEESRLTIAPEGRGDSLRLGAEMLLKRYMLLSASLQASALTNSPKAFSKADTTIGSNCLPAWSCNSARACACVMADR